MWCVPFRELHLLPRSLICERSAMYKRIWTQNVLVLEASSSASKFRFYILKSLIKVYLSNHFNKHLDSVQAIADSTCHENVILASMRHPS